MSVPRTASYSARQRRVLAELGLQPLHRRVPAGQSDHGEVTGSISIPLASRNLAGPALELIVAPADHALRDALLRWIPAGVLRADGQRLTLGLSAAVCADHALESPLALARLREQPAQKALLWRVLRRLRRTAAG